MGCGRNPHHVRGEFGTGLVMPMPSVSRVLAVSPLRIIVQSAEEAVLCSLFPATEELLGRRHCKVERHETRPDGGDLHGLVPRDAERLERTIVRPGPTGPPVARQVHTAGRDLGKEGLDRLLELQDAVTPEDISIAHGADFLDGIHFERVRLVCMRWASDLVKRRIGKDRNLGRVAADGGAKAIEIGFVQSRPKGDDRGCRIFPSKSTRPDLHSPFFNPTDKCTKEELVAPLALALQ